MISKEVRAEVDKRLAEWKRKNQEAYDRFNEQYIEHVKKHLNGDLNTKMEGILPMMGSTTNDPKGEYKRKPMLDSDELYDEYLGDCPGNVGGTVIEKIINFYEGKIDDGTLMAVKTVKLEWDGYGYMTCSGCDINVEPSQLTGDKQARSFNFCPGCGTKIIE